MTYLVAWTTKNGPVDVTDHIEVYDTPELAQSRYEKILKRADLFSASIFSNVVASTDYEVTPQLGQGEAVAIVSGGNNIAWAVEGALNNYPVGTKLYTAPQSKPVDERLEKAKVIAASPEFKQKLGEAIAAMPQTQLPNGAYAGTPVDEREAFLLNGARFKISFFDGVCGIAGIPFDLNGQWVALVDATDNVHLQARAALKPAVPEEWQLIKSAPKDGRTILLGYFNCHAKWRTLRGKWYRKDVIDDEWENAEDFDAGWFETSVEADDVPSCWPTSPTHWMPLPKPPTMIAAAKEQDDD